jgi:hypothetical protein
MDLKEFAATLDGREYPFELTRDEKDFAKDANWVVVYNDSDDNMEFRGAITDEVGCYGGGVAYITKDAELLVNECDDEDCPYFRKLIGGSIKIDAVDGTWWELRTVIPHETFNIMEDGDLYGIGIVFDRNNLGVKNE